MDDILIQFMKINLYNVYSVRLCSFLFQMSMSDLDFSQFYAESGCQIFCNFLLSPILSPKLHREKPWEPPFFIQKFWRPFFVTFIHSTPEEKTNLRLFLDFCGIGEPPYGNPIINYLVYCNLYWNRNLLKVLWNWF